MHTETLSIFTMFAAAVIGDIGGTSVEQWERVNALMPGTIMTPFVEG